MASRPTVNGIDFGTVAVNLSGSVANTGIAGQGSSSGIAVPGGLVRANSATNGRGAAVQTRILCRHRRADDDAGSHLVKVGGEVRMIRMTTDRLGGTTYTYSNINAFLANTPSTVQYLGDLSAPSVFNNGATGQRHAEQEYYIGYAQDEWQAGDAVTLNYGLRYDYYTPMQGARQPAGQVQHRHRRDRSATRRRCSSRRKNNFQPRVSG